MKSIKPKRWTLEEAASEFRINPRTLSSRIKAGGFLPGKDGKFSTIDIASAVYGDIDGERLRDVRLSADLKEIQKHQALREWIPAVLVEKVWANTVTDLRQKILMLEITDARKAEILTDLQTIPIDEYFATATQAAVDETGKDEE